MYGKSFLNQECIVRVQEPAHAYMCMFKRKEDEKAWNINTIIYKSIYRSWTQKKRTKSWGSNIISATGTVPKNPVTGYCRFL